MLWLSGCEDETEEGSVCERLTPRLQRALEGALQLQAEEKLSLEAPLATWLPDFPRADRITVRQLLNHTSGAFDYTSSQDFFDQAEANLGKTWTVEALIALCAAESPAFEPGTRWEYSNTNYILLGHILEAVTGTPLAQQLRTRLLEPLDLDSTGMDGAEPLPWSPAPTTSAPSNRRSSSARCSLRCSSRR